MLKITNGVVTIEVTRGAFNNTYCRRGFRPITDAECDEKDGVDNFTPSSDSHEADEPSHEIEQNNDDYEDEEQIDYSEIPLSELTFDDLCDYADQLGLDHSGIRSKKDLRALIRGHLNNS